MGPGGKKRGRRASWAVLAAVLSLFVQALLPAAAMTAESVGAARIELCTSEGARTVAVDAAGKVREGFAGLPCHDCLAATLAAALAPDLAVTPITYATARLVQVPAPRPLQPRARAPPRPHGQGPPVPIA